MRQIAMIESMVLRMGNAPPAQQPEISRGLNRDMAASKLHYRKRS